jgi:predicted XRE-type DNA-binding protein
MPRDPVVMSLRRQLAAEIVRSLGPSAYYAMAKRFGFSQPRWSELERAKVERYSIEWLIRRIGRLGGSVRITVTLGDVGREWNMAARARGRASRAAKSGAGKVGAGKAGDGKAGETTKLHSAPRSKSGIRVVL